MGRSGTGRLRWRQVLAVYYRMFTYCGSPVHSLLPHDSMLSAEGEQGPDRRIWRYMNDARRIRSVPSPTAWAARRL